MNFIDICKMGQKELKHQLVKELTNNGYKPVNQDGFIYAEGDIPVLLVAHMDTVHKEKCKIICESSDGVLMSPQGIGGDDRCGIFMILETIKELRCSVLFTEDEEIGCVGADKFCKSEIVPSVEFKYIIEYDRKNADDAVFYDCDNKDFESFVTDEEIGFKTAYGSCSDISYVAPHLKTAAVNLSCGYYNQHTQHEYVVVPEMLKNIERGKQLIRKPCEHFEYIEKEYDWDKYKYGYGNYGGYYDYSGYGTSKKRPYGDHYFDSYEDIYANIDEVAITLYEDAYGKTIKRKDLVPVKELVDYGKKEFVVYSSEGKVDLEEYAETNVLYMDVKGCELYIVSCDNTWGIQSAIQTGDKLVCKDGSTIMYWPDTMEEDVPVFAAEDQNDFDDYVDNYMEYDINYSERLGVLL